MIREMAFEDDEELAADRQADQEVDEPRSRRRLPWRVLAALGIGALLLLVVFDTFRAAQPAPSPADMRTAVAQALASATPSPSIASQVYRQVRPSVVLIQTYSDRQTDRPDGEGSGVIVDQAGLILTALHVVDNAGRIVVTFADGNTSDAQILSQQPENDTAVLQVPELPPLITPAVLGNPDALQVGDEAVVIGNPFGLVGSLSAGSISGLGRTFAFTDTGRTLNNLIQFDASVNPGNSGGPLLNRNGEVVGIVTSLLNPTDDHVFIGIGFAVPITTASRGLGESPF